MKGFANGPTAAYDSADDDRHVLITGGAGFIGTNLAHRLAGAGRRVLIYDNLSRPGVARNLAWLKSIHDDRIAVMVADIRDATAVNKAVCAAGSVYHLAAQVAVTTSLVDPSTDFAINAHGTLLLLEAIRGSPHRPPLVFTSTNKVYGAIEDLPLERGPTRYSPRQRHPARRGIDETRALDFHSPYGCSKGASDQYVLDYARSYGLSTLVFRMSCIYGPHQCGSEDQGWVAHFLLSTLADEPITFYGDGRQVRDILYVDDLVDALLLAQTRMSELAGQAYNIGGGAGNTVSLIELVEHIAALHGRSPTLHYAAPRTGDQLYYVSDHSRFAAAAGWSPRVSAEDGVARLYRWLADRRTARPPAAPPRHPAAGLREKGRASAADALQPAREAT